VAIKTRGKGSGLLRSFDKFVTLLCEPV
jgi:hypothetical protein